MFVGVALDSEVVPFLTFTQAHSFCILTCLVNYEILQRKIKILFLPECQLIIDNGIVITRVIS